MVGPQLISMRIYYQIYSPHLQQGIPSIVLSLQHPVNPRTFVFNLPSNFARYLSSHNMQVPKRPAVFFTKVSADTTAGLLGFIYTMIFLRAREFTPQIYTHAHLYDYLEGLRINKLKHMMLAVSYTDLAGGGRTRLGLQTLQAIRQAQLADRSNQALLGADDYLRRAYPSQFNDSSQLVTEAGDYDDGFSKVQALQMVADGESIVSYIFSCGAIKDKLDSSKAKQLGLSLEQQKDLYTKQSITIDSGRTVSLAELKQPEFYGSCLMIFHYNSLESIQKLAAHAKLHKFAQDYRTKHSGCQVIHILEQKVEELVESQQFKQLVCWLSEKFYIEAHATRQESTVKHIVYNRKYANRVQDLLAEKPQPYSEFIQSSRDSGFTCVPEILALNTKFIKDLISNKQIKLIQDFMPACRYVYQNSFVAFRMHHESELSQAGQFQYGPYKENLNDGRKNILTFSMRPGKSRSRGQIEPVPTRFNNFAETDPFVAFLGTVSAMPHICRNVSGIYLEMVSHQGVLLDCGEGSYQQLYNHFGGANIEQKLTDLKIIFITHFHNDHSEGVFELIAQRNRVLRRRLHRQGVTGQQSHNLMQKQRVFLVIPYAMARWYDQFCTKIEDISSGCNVLFIQTILDEKSQVHLKPRAALFRKSVRPATISIEQQLEMSCEEENEKYMVDYREHVMRYVQKYQPHQQHIHHQFREYLEGTGLVQFQPVHVDHCPQSYGIVIAHKSGAKVSYSGDCRPSAEFAKAAEGSALMIHEATCRQSEKEEAVYKKHSTFQQAVEMAIKSGSWKLVTTHFKRNMIGINNLMHKEKDILTSAEKKQYAEKHCMIAFDHLQFRLSQAGSAVWESKTINWHYPSYVVNKNFDPRRALRKETPQRK